MLVPKLPKLNRHRNKSGLQYWKFSYSLGRIRTGSSYLNKLKLLFCVQQDTRKERPQHSTHVDSRHAGLFERTGHVQARSLSASISASRFGMHGKRSLALEPNLVLCDSPVDTLTFDPSGGGDPSNQGRREFEGIMQWILRESWRVVCETELLSMPSVNFWILLVSRLRLCMQYELCSSPSFSQFVAPYAHSVLFKNLLPCKLKLYPHGQRGSKPESGPDSCHDWKTLKFLPELMSALRCMQGFVIISLVTLVLIHCIFCCHQCFGQVPGHAHCNS